MASFEHSFKYDQGGADATERVPPGVALGGARSVATAADRCNDFMKMIGGIR